MKRIITWRPGMKVSARSKGRVKRQQLEKWRMQAGHIGIAPFKKGIHASGSKLIGKHWWTQKDLKKLGGFKGIRKYERSSAKTLDKLHRIAVKEGWRSK